SRPCSGPRSRRPPLRPSTVGRLAARASFSTPTRYSAGARWARAAKGNTPTSERRTEPSRIAVKRRPLRSMPLLLHQWATATVDRTERLGCRIGGAELVQIPRTFRLGRLLHLEQIHRVDLSAILTDGALAEEGIIGGERLHLRDHPGAVVALQRVDCLEIVEHRRVDPGLRHGRHGAPVTPGEAR